MLLSILGFIYGSILGSLAGALLPRLDQGQSWLKGRSQCDHCHQDLSFSKLIPLFSYLYFHGKSSCCQKKIPSHYWKQELVLGLLFALYFAFFYQESLVFWAELSIWSFWALLSLQDSRYQYIHEGLYFTGILSTCFLLFLNLDELHWGTISVQILISLVFFGSQYFLTKGKGLGFGDLELGLWMALILWKGNITEAIFFAYISASCLAITGLVLKKITKKSRIPLAPFLAFGTFLAYYGPDVLPL